MRLHALRLALVGVVLLAAAGRSWAGDAASTPDREPPAPIAASPLARAKSWGYQLQGIDVDRLSQAPHDVLVIDYSRDGSQGEALTARHVERLRSRPDGSPRIVLAYLSIGEAEDYRYYWRWYWTYTRWPIWSWAWRLLGEEVAPAWLGAPNQDWGGNYAVRYWDPRWQQLILGAGGYLDRILKAGFDGVYLDKVDSSLEDVAKARPGARRDMAAFVALIAGRGRAARPGFLVVPQNGEELLTDAAYRAVIDGLGKEDLLYGELKERQRNPADVIARRIALLKPLLAEGKPVLAVEYLDDPALIAQTRAELAGLGLVPHFADRALARMRFTDLPEAGAKGRRR